MQFSKETLQILKNYAELNSNFLFKEGNYVATKTDKVISYAKIDEHIPKTFGIYDLNNFLSVLNIDKSDYDLVFDDEFVNVTSMNGRNSIRYSITNPTMLLIPESQEEVVKKSDGKIKIQTNPEFLIPNYNTLLPKFKPTVTFELSQEDYDRILKVSRILGNTHIAIENDGTLVKLIAFNDKTSSCNTNSITLDIPVIDNIYKLIFTIEKFNILSGKYFVEISERGMSKFTNLDRELVYFIPLESSSYFR